MFSVLDTETTGLWTLREGKHINWAAYLPWLSAQRHLTIGIGSWRRAGKVTVLLNGWDWGHSYGMLTWPEAAVKGTKQQAAMRGRQISGDVPVWLTAARTQKSSSSGWYWNSCLAPILTTSIHWSQKNQSSLEQESYPKTNNKKNQKINK